MVGQSIYHAIVGGVPCPPWPVAFIVERRRRSLLLVNAGDVEVVTPLTVLMTRLPAAS
jgi:hypothetical protein